MAIKGYIADNRDLYETHLRMATEDYLSVDPWSLVQQVIENAPLGDMRQDELIADLMSIRHKLEEALGYVEERG